MLKRTFLLLLCSILAIPLFTSQATATNLKLLQTGQVTCYKADNTETTCAGTGRDGEQKSGVDWPDPRFTDNNNGTVTDNLTGLMWVKDAVAAGSLTWQKALEHVTSMNGADGGHGALGHNDWRLPNRNELNSLINLQQPSSSIWLNSPKGTFSGVEAGNYWSSSSDANNTDKAWAVGMSSGDIYSSSKLNSNFVWPVRTAQAPSTASLDVSPANKAFGEVGTNKPSLPQIFTLSSTGSTSVIITSFEMTGTDIGMFTLNVGDGTGGTCGTTMPITLAPAASCTLSLAFAPTSLGAKTATLKINTGNTSPPFKNVGLTGTGVTPRYSVTAGVVGGYGGIFCPTPVLEGNSATCTMSSLAGYHLATFTDNGADMSASVAANKYTLTNVTDDHVIIATFAKIIVDDAIIINNSDASTSNPLVNLTLAYPGAAYMQFLVDKKAVWTKWEPFLAAKAVKLLGKTGIKTVAVRFKDAQGGESPIYSATIFLDVAAPVGTISIENGVGYTTSTTVSLNLTASDSGNGLLQMRFSENGTTWFEDWADFSATASYTFGTHPPGNVLPGLKKVYVQFRDAGLKVSKNIFDTITYLGQAPEVSTNGTIVINSGAAYTITTTVAVAFTPPGGETYVRLSNDPATLFKARWFPVSAVVNWHLTSGDGIKTVYAQYSPDMTALTPIYSGSIILDVMTPRGWLLINNGASVTGSTTVNLTMGSSDANGTAKMCIKETSAACLEGEYEDFAPSKSYTILTIGDGTKNVFIHFKDNAGKISLPIKAAITLDTTDPVGTIIINGGAATTTNATVSVKFTAIKAVYMQISTDDGVTWGEWEAYASIKSVIFTPDPGVKTVRVKFKDFAGHESAEYSDAIELL